MSTNIIPEIFVSYAWETDSEKIVEKFNAACENRGYLLKRDKTDIQFKELITGFMKTLGKGRFIVVILSDKYLKSENCMFELLEIVKNGDFYNRIFPIITDSTNIYKPIGRIKYIKHWENEISELNNAMTELASQADLSGVREAIDHYTKIRAMIGDLTNILRDMNSLSVQQHVSANFEDIFNIIDKEVNQEIQENSTPSIGIQDFEKGIVEKKQDRTIANILKVWFPDKLYTARLSINRDEIIEKSWDTDFKLKRNSSDRKVTLRALNFTKKPFGKEFQVYNKILISFINLDDRSKAYSHIIDPASIEEFTIEEFLLVNVDHEPVLISLLKICLNEMLKQKDIEWVENEECYRFKSGPLPKEKKITWKGIKQATRTVIFERYNKDKQIVAFRHLGFSTSFLHLQSGFYLTINPTWSITKDGNSEYNFAANEIATQKRLENNQTVYNHFRFIQYCLVNSLSEKDTYNFLELQEIEDFNAL